jgi:VWFA-related protein
MLLLLILLALPAFGQTFRVTVDLVQVDAVVTDSKGKLVRNLEAADFQVFEDGKPRTITNFSWVEAGVAGAAGKPRRSIVLMADDSYWHAEEDVPPLLNSMRKFVAEQLGPGDLAAVTASRGGMGFYQQFTGDKQQLYAAIDRLVHRRGFGIWNVDIPLMPDPVTGALKPAFDLASGEPALGFRDPKNPPNPIGHLLWAIQGLQKVPGRKAVVLFTQRFPAPPQLIDMANRAGVVVYVIDTHGHLDGVVPSKTPYRQLAEQTGGLFLQSAAGGALDRDLARVLDDLSGYYLIGFHPEKAGLRREISVKVARKGLQVRARHGYLGVPDAPVAAASKTPLEHLQEAIASPFSAASLKVRLEPHYRPHLKKTLFRADLFVDGHRQKKAVFSALITIAAEDGTPVAQEAKTYTLDLADAQGVRLSLETTLATAGPYQVRAAVRDDTTGDIGSAYTFVDVPDFNAPKLALTTIEMAAPDATRSVRFQCGVFGFRAPRPRLEMQAIAFREGDEKPAANSGVQPVPAATVAEHVITGQFDTAGLAPGEYTLQITAWDRLASARQQPAVQWTRFVVAP